MLVYKCPKCGVIYSKKDVPENEMCSSCDTYLKVVNIKEDTVHEKEKKVITQSSVGRQSVVGRVRTTPEIPTEEKDEKVNNDIRESHDNNVIEEESNYSYSHSVDQITNINVIEGTVISAVNDAGYKRLPWEKLYDRYFYSQNVSNIQNSIYVRCVDINGNISNKTIVMYGQIKGGIGMFRTGMKIKGEGKINSRKEFVAKSLMLEDGASVNTRTEPADIIYYFSPLILVLICFVIINFTELIKDIISSEYVKWYPLSIIGSFFVSYYALGRVVRIPIVNKIRTCTWVSIILGTIIFFICKSIFVT